METIIILAACALCIFTLLGFFIYHLLKNISPEMLNIFKTDKNLDALEEKSNQEKYID